MNFGFICRHNIKYLNIKYLQHIKYLQQIDRGIFAKKLC